MSYRLKKNIDNIEVSPILTKSQTKSKPKTKTKNQNQSTNSQKQQGKNGRLINNYEIKFTSLK